MIAFACRAPEDTLSTSARSLDYSLRLASCLLPLFCAWPCLGAGEPVPAAPAPLSELADVDRELAELEESVENAYFRSALAMVESTRDLLDTFEPTPEMLSRRARLEVLAATAQIALGERAEAHASLRRALRSDPALALDERTTSPKLIEALRKARR